MRRSRRTRGGDDGDVDMTPMLDIVFIMLIFFIVTATFLDRRRRKTIIRRRQKILRLRFMLIAAIPAQWMADAQLAIR